jgi:hypothetical protein
MQIKCVAAKIEQQNSVLLVLALMSPPASSPFSAQRGLRQTVRMPRESDGVGNALRQIFGASGMPVEISALLNRLNKED